MVFSHLSLGGISEASACFLSIPSLDSRLCLAWSRVQFLVFSQKFLCPSLFRLCCGRVVDNVFRQTNKQTQTQSSRRLLRRKIASGHLGSACVVPWRTHLYCCASLTSSVQALRGTTPFWICHYARAYAARNYGGYARRRRGMVRCTSFRV